MFDSRVRSIGAFALGALLCSVTAYAQVNDPAIIACEELAKRDMPAGGIYTRRDASINGTIVTISFQVQVMTTAPDAKSIACPFKLNEQTDAFYYNVAGSGEAAERERNRATLIMMGTGLYPVAKDKTALR